MRNSYANHGASVNNGPDVPPAMRGWEFAEFVLRTRAHQLVIAEGA